MNRRAIRVAEHLKSRATALLALPRSSNSLPALLVKTAGLVGGIGTLAGAAGTALLTVRTAEAESSDVVVVMGRDHAPARSPAW